MLPDESELYETVFQRYEIKYELDKEQYDAVMTGMMKYMEEDIYGESIIRNIYFDTDDFRLVRRSLEKPDYKEKLRLRCYSQVGLHDDVFMELKKKYAGIVYKRRTVMKEYQALEYVRTGELPGRDQVSREIDYFGRFYQTLKPRVYISYDRTGYVGKDDPLLRITMDRDIMYRTRELDLLKGPAGKRIFPADRYLMEVKVRYGVPVWLSRILSEKHIVPTSFSKYGTAFTDMLITGAGQVPVTRYKSA
ncbi:MAG: polyphosphate polymerase domain-containing protein [Lachnospiraceae bacterium]|nr:polyphosphate polymerase domain-containing protein [Lachnospiraceae bacterium]